LNSPFDFQQPSDILCTPLMELTQWIHGKEWSAVPVAGVNDSSVVLSQEPQAWNSVPHSHMKSEMKQGETNNSRKWQLEWEWEEMIVIQVDRIFAYIRIMFFHSSMFLNINSSMFVSSEVQLYSNIPIQGGCTVQWRAFDTIHGDQWFHAWVLWLWNLPPNPCLFRQRSVYSVDSVITCVLTCTQHLMAVYIPSYPMFSSYQHSGLSHSRFYRTDRRPYTLPFCRGDFPDTWSLCHYLSHLRHGWIHLVLTLFHSWTLVTLSLHAPWSAGHSPTLSLHVSLVIVIFCHPQCESLD
jgi:hypothetical protein